MIKIAIPQMGNDLFRKYMKSKYQKSLEAAGAAAVWIELDSIEKAVSEALACDGLLLPGGADVNPSLYGEEKSIKCGNPNELRDRFEPQILKDFLETGKPILGICRGAQIINVYFGGTLFQDIKDTQKVKHSDFFGRAKSTHSIDICEDSLLFEIIKSKKCGVNSIHHQAINKVGEDLTVVAVSEDGFTEAVENKAYGFCLAIQWHPEHMAKKDEAQMKIFSSFVRACEGE